MHSRVLYFNRQPQSYTFAVFAFKPDLARILPGTVLLLHFYAARALHQRADCSAEQSTCLWLPAKPCLSEPCRKFRLVETKHIILRMIILPITLYYVQGDCRSKFHVLTQVLFEAKLVHLCQMFEVLVINEAQGMHSSDEFADCRPYLFAWS